MHVSKTTLFVIALACLVPVRSNAAFTDLARRAMSWWDMRSISQSSAPKAQDTSDKPKKDDQPEPPRASGMCQVPKEPSATVCEGVSGFLCVDSPPGGVAGDSVFITGTIDRKAPTNIRILSQNEYTKKTIVVDTSHPAEGDCKDPKGKSFCLSPDGHFTARVPLKELGPYTIAVSASRLSGKSEERKVRTSRVVPLKFDQSGVSFDPDVKSQEGALHTTDAPVVNVKIKLLGDCRFCDFIGAATGGVVVTAKNTIRDDQGSSKSISCSTSVEQGGQGQFSIGMPIMPGGNSITISACNAAHPSDKCPTLGPITFTRKGAISSLEILSPPAQPFYDQDEYPTIRWEFSVGEEEGTSKNLLRSEILTPSSETRKMSEKPGGVAGSYVDGFFAKSDEVAAEGAKLQPKEVFRGALECVRVRLNREAPSEVCPSTPGRYVTEITPRVGINVVTVSQKNGSEDFAWTFGWGDIISPFADTKGLIEVPDAMGIAVPAHTINGILLPLINNFLNSDELGKMLEKLFTKGEEGSEETHKADTSRPKIPKCDGQNMIGNFVVSPDGTPKMEKAKIKNLSIQGGKIEFQVVLDNVQLGLKLAPDNNKDGKGDRDPLPIIIAFRKAIIETIIDAGAKDDDGNPLILITSGHDDCAYKSGYYCTHTPAPLIPRNFVGGTNNWGGFVKCDVERAGPEAKEACEAINAINEQTGLIHENILDAINNAIYCNGSEFATAMVQKGIALGDLELGCADETKCKGTIDCILPNIRLPLGIKLEKGVAISPSGIAAVADILVGDSDLFRQTPDKFRIETAGLIVNNKFKRGVTSSASGAEGDLDADISLDAVNALLFAATAQGDGRSSKGLIDFDVSEQLFGSFGFDFVKECDAFTPVPGKKESPPSLCYIRPRVSELLGPALTTYGYFPAKQPLLLAIRGNRALGPRLTAATYDTLLRIVRSEDDKDTQLQEPTGGQLIELALGGVMFSFYALEQDKSKGADQYGNLPIKRDANGRPVISSMRPDDPDPWNGPIVSFDLTVLLAIELGGIEPMKDDESQFVMRAKILSDRSRLVLVPITESNATVVPPNALVSSLSEKLKLALTGYSTDEDTIRIPIPKEIALDADGDDNFKLLGLKKIVFGPKGLSLDLDPERNAIEIAIRAVITQLLHEGGREVEHRVP